MHPGAVGDAVLKWTAPRAGTIRITGSVFDGDGSCGNGIVASIWHNSTQLAQYIIDNGDANGKKHDLTEVVASNDSIYFVVNSRDGDNACDTTNWSPTIEFD